MIILTENPQQVNELTPESEFKYYKFWQSIKENNELLLIPGMYFKEINGQAFNLLCIDSNNESSANIFLTLAEAQELKKFLIENLK